MGTDFGFIVEGINGGGSGTNYWSLAAPNIIPNVQTGILVNNFGANGTSTFNGLADFNAAINYKVVELTAPQPADTYTVLANDYIIGLGQGVTYATNVVLPASPALGRTLYIKDAGLLAATVPITIVAGANTIDGSPTFLFTEDYQSIEITWNGAEWMVLAENNAPIPASYWTALGNYGIEYQSGSASVYSSMNIQNGLQNYAPIGAGTGAITKFYPAYDGSSGIYLLTCITLFAPHNNTTKTITDIVVTEVYSDPNRLATNVYLTNEPTFSQSNLIGQDIGGAGQYGITLSTPVILNNDAVYLWVCFDLDNFGTIGVAQQIIIDYLWVNGIQEAAPTTKATVGGYTQNGLSLINNDWNNGRVVLGEASEYWLGTVSDNSSPKYIKSANFGDLFLYAASNPTNPAQEANVGLATTSSSFITHGDIELNDSVSPFQASAKATFNSAIYTAPSIEILDGSTYTIQDTDYFVYFTISAIDTIYLPVTPTEGRWLVIGDGGGTASTFPFTIDANGNSFRDAGTTGTITIKNDFGYVYLCFSAGQWAITTANFWMPTATGIEYTGTNTSVKELTANSTATFKYGINYHPTIFDGSKGTTYICTKEDYFVATLTHTIGSASAVFLETTTEGRTIIVKDTEGYAATSTITIYDNSGYLIDGASTYTINTAYGCQGFTAVADGFGGFYWNVLNPQSAVTPITNYWTPLDGLGIKYLDGGISALKTVNSYDGSAFTSRNRGNSNVVSLSYWNCNYDYLPFTYGTYPVTRLCVWADSIGSTPAFNSITFSARIIAGTIGAPIDSIRLYSSGTNKDFDILTANLLAYQNYVFGDIDYTLTAPTPVPLTEGLNYFWLAWFTASGLVVIPASYIKQVVLSDAIAGSTTYLNPPQDPTGSGFYIDNFPAGQLVFNIGDGLDSTYILPDVGTWQLGTNIIGSNADRVLKAPNAVNSNNNSGNSSGVNFIIEGSGKGTDTSGAISGDITIRTVTDNTTHATPVTELKLSGFPNAPTYLGDMTATCRTFITTGARVVKTYFNAFSTTYTVADDDYWVTGSSATTSTIYLPAIPVLGRTLVIQNSGSGLGNMSVDGNGNLINITAFPYYTSAYSLAGNNLCITLIYNGTEWYITAKN